MMGSSHATCARLLAQLVVILLACRLAGWVARRLGQTAVIGELVAGVLLGPSLLGTVAPELQRWLFPTTLTLVVGDSTATVIHPSMVLLFGLSQVGLTLCMFVIGLGLNTALAQRERRQAGAISLMGVGAIVEGGDERTVVGLAVLIAVIAVVEAGVGLAERWQSSRIGEGLILDLRRAVFEHVQRMPVAFFTRTRTGALVSRLNSDVIGAQRAFTSTLSSVVGNTIALVLTLAVMIGLSWQVTLLALLLLPVFVLPARRMGNRLASLEREAAAHNSAMTSQMTERFSAPGATLVKLYSRPTRRPPSSATERSGCATSGSTRPWSSGCSSRR